MGPDDEPLMKILATSDEVVAVGDAITHYMEYVDGAPAVTKEEKETVELLKRLQKRLVNRTAEKGTPGKARFTT